MKILADSEELDARRWSMDAGGHIRLNGPFPYGTVFSVQWEFGDILAFRDPPKTPRFMYLAAADDIDPSADNPIWVMSLNGEATWIVGHITTRNRSIFQLVEAVSE